MLDVTIDFETAGGIRNEQHGRKNKTDSWNTDIQETWNAKASCLEYRQPNKHGALV